MGRVGDLGGPSGADVDVVAEELGQEDDGKHAGQDEDGAGAEHLQPGRGQVDASPSVRGPGAAHWTDRTNADAGAGLGGVMVVPHREVLEGSSRVHGWSAMVSWSSRRWAGYLGGVVVGAESRSHGGHPEPGLAAPSRSLGGPDPVVVIMGSLQVFLLATYVRSGSRRSVRDEAGQGDEAGYGGDGSSRSGVRLQQVGPDRARDEWCCYVVVLQLFLGQHHRIDVRRRAVLRNDSARCRRTPHRTGR